MLRYNALLKYAPLVCNRGYNFNHVAIVTTSKGSVLSVGKNIGSTHPIMIPYPKGMTVHAEIDAIVKVDKSIFYNGTKIIVYSLRFNRKGKLRNAKPCKFCQRILERYNNIGIIYYSDSDGKIQTL